jgi:hypothetical protein
MIADNGNICISFLKNMHLLQRDSYAKMKNYKYYEWRSRYMPVQIIIIPADLIAFKAIEIRDAEFPDTMIICPDTIMISIGRKYRGGNFINNTGDTLKLL